MWTFFCYDDGKPGNLWARWYAKRNNRVQARHDVTLRILDQREAVDWVEPWAKHLKKGLFQIYVKTDVQWRILGYFGSDHKVTIVLVCNHKDGVYDPPNAITKARDIKDSIEKGSAKEKRCAIPRRL